MPTYNERDNIGPLIDAVLASARPACTWCVVLASQA